MAGLAPGDADPRLPVQVVSTGVPQVHRAGRATPARSPALRPDYDGDRRPARRARRDRLLPRRGRPGAGAVRARSFMRTAEKGEDPATGAAAGPLCAHVAERTGVEALEIDQGVEMGRPSRLRAAVEGDRVRVGGDVVVVVDGTVRLDF